MKTSLFRSALLAVALMPGVLALRAPAQNLEPIVLPPAQMEGGKPLLTALKQRQTTREFQVAKLPPQTLANLLWAGFGINRPEIDHRTAPSAMNSQEVDIYVALPEALYVYEAKPHRLKPVLAGDLRPKISSQAFAKDAAAIFVYVADLPRLAKAKPETRPLYARIDTGCICQNVYLCCASEGLGAVVFDLDRAPLAAAMQLRSDQEITLAQAIGFPRAKKP